MASILKQTDFKSRYYGDFRGVDFSSDHAQVADTRLAYLVNMYKDYQSAEGKAIETIAGFRRRVVIKDKEIYGIHYFKADGKLRVLIHAGDGLYLWHNYPASIGVEEKDSYRLGSADTRVNGTNIFTLALKDTVIRVVTVTKANGEDITFNTEFNRESGVLTIARSDVFEGDTVYITYLEGELLESDAIFMGMSERKSESFIMNNRLYLKDGLNYLVYDGERVKDVREDAYIPTTYINIIPSGENADIGTEHEARNILSPHFKHTFIADGATKEFYMNDNNLEGIFEVRVYGQVVTNYTADLVAGKITFAEAPKKPEDVVQITNDNGDDVTYPEFYAGVEITATKAIRSITGLTDNTGAVGSMITRCTLAHIFDNRVFFAGHPEYPNHIFWCGRNLTGYTDPSYIGILNYMQDGVGSTPITGLVSVADTLMVLKADTQQDGAVYFHTPTDTGNDINPRAYPSTQGLAGIGCLGACTNFLDDPVFISRLGLEAIGQLSVRYERAIEHRSSLVDAVLVNLDLSKATLCEWNGYLVCLVDGKAFLADSRQRYTHESGVMQYEWYYLEGLGIYDNQYAEYKYADTLPAELEGIRVPYTTASNEDIELELILADAVYNEISETYEDLRGKTANSPDVNGEATAESFTKIVTISLEDGTETDIAVAYVVRYVEGAYRAYLCDIRGGCIGGVYSPAVCIKEMDNNLFFGTQNGIVCSFNFDKRNERGEILPRYYTFDDRTIMCGCATKMDNCGIPHMTKTTVKKSMVIKTKSMLHSAAKIKVRTNRVAYTQVARINSGTFSFEDMDFGDMSLSPLEQSLSGVKEKEKKWVEKQLYIYSDEYMKPFALYNIAFRYKIAGRFK